MDYLKEFKVNIDKGEYMKAAHIYCDQAYKYQKEFNKILEVDNSKTLVLDLVSFIMYDGEHWVDPAGGTHSTDDNNPTELYE